jgi:predicted  nucleic acid-binding Zn-ribbon protein
MTVTCDDEPTLRDLVNKLDKLTSNVEALSNDVESLSNDVESLSNNAKRFDERFADYRQATQSVVQVAFTLIASATLTVIITSVLRR